MGGGGGGGARSRGVEERCWMMMWCLMSSLRCRADIDIRVNEMLDFGAYYLNYTVWLLLHEACLRDVDMFWAMSYGDFLKCVCVCVSVCLSVCLCV